MKKILFADPLEFTNPVRLGGRQFAIQFAKYGWEVYFFSNPLTPFNIWKDRSNVKERLNIHNKGGVYLDNVWAYVPFTFIPHHNNVPILNKKLFLDNYYKFTIPSISSIIKRKNIGNIEILWMDCNNQAFWTKILRYRKLVYRVPDNIFAFKQKSTATIAAHYYLMDRADLILFTSRLLIEQKENIHYRHKIVHCPNGVDPNNFCQKNDAVPIEYLKLERKYRALYVGTIDEWFDFELLKILALACKEVSFIIIGPLKTEIPFPMSDNVVFLGKRAYDQIPNYIQHCDIGIIPFKNSDLVKYVNPIKIYEFLALGKTVISSFWEELALLNAPISLARNRDEFISLLENIEKTSEKFTEEEIEFFTKNNTWEARYKLVMDHLQIEK